MSGLPKTAVPLPAIIFHFLNRYFAYMGRPVELQLTGWALRPGSCRLQRARFRPPSPVFLNLSLRPGFFSDAMPLAFRTPSTFMLVSRRSTTS